MRRIYTIEVVVRDDDRVDKDDRFDEFQYWTGQVETYVKRLQRDISEAQERAHNRLNWQAVDLTTIDIKERN